MIKKHPSSCSTFSPEAVAVSFIHLSISGCSEGAVSSGGNPRWRHPRHSPPGHRPRATSTERGREHDEPTPINASLRHVTVHCQEVGDQECKKRDRAPNLPRVCLAWCLGTTSLECLWLQDEAHGAATASQPLMVCSRPGFRSWAPRRGNSESSDGG